MKILGKELTFNGNKVYHAGNKPTASEIGAAAASHGRHIPDVCETITDWNNATKNGWYMGNNATNSPTANAWYFGEVIVHNANYVVQTVYQFTASTDAKAIPKYIRAKMNGTWGAWTNVTVAKAVPSNAVFTDTNTWRGVQDNLTSTATDQSLSANQGKVLKGLIDGKAASNHTHSYLPLSGGTLTSSIKFSGGGYNNHAIRMEAGDANGAFIGIGAGGLTVIGSGESTNAVRTALTNGADETMIVASDQTIRFLTGVQNGYSSAKEVSINAAGVINAPQGMTGNATTATKLQTARTINGTSFDGSGNITTANWGTARTLTVGKTGKSVNGSGNVSWSLAEIGAIGADTSGTYVGMTGPDGNTSNWIRTTTQGIIPSDQSKTSSVGTSSWQFKAMYATTFYGALSGNASTATKLQTARTITLSGDVTGSASFDGSANASIAVNNRRCVVGQTSNTNTNPYYKFATITISGNHQDREIVFKVSTGYSQNTASGILRAHLRTNSEGLLDNAQFNWEYANIGIDPSKFIMAYSTTTPMVVELWAKVDSAYLHYHFDVIQEHDRGDSRSRWTLYTTCAAGSASAITSGYTQLVSTRLNIANSITGNANTATTLQTARTINGTSFNGSGNITTANWGTARNITIGNTTKSVNGSANVSWTAAEIGVASINDSTTATGTVWSSNKTQVQINTSYNTMSQKVDALEESINRDFVSKNGSTMTGDLTIKKSNGAAAKLNVHRTINSNDMQGTIDIYAHNGGSVALSTNNKTSGKQTSSYVFGGDAFWSPRNADGTVPSIGLSNYRFEKAWLNKLDVKDAIFTSGNLTVQGQTTLGPTILNNNTSLYGCNTSGTQINICGVDNSNNIYLGWNNQTYINVNNTMRVYRDLHILNGNALRVTGQTVLARTESYRQIAVVSTAGDGNGKGDGQTHLGYFDSGYHHYFRGSGAMHVDMLGGLRIDGKRLSIGSAAHSNPATGDVWIQI